MLYGLLIVSDGSDCLPLQLVRIIRGPRWTHARVVETSDRQEQAVILTLQAFFETPAAGQTSVVSDLVGCIKVDRDTPLPKWLRYCYNRGAVVEVDFFENSWWLRRVCGKWREDIDLANLVFPEVRDSSDEEFAAERCSPKERTNSSSSSPRRTSSPRAGCRSDGLSQASSSSDRPRQHMDVAARDDRCHGIRSSDSARSEPIELEDSTARMQKLSLASGDRRATSVSSLSSRGVFCEEIRRATESSVSEPLVRSGLESQSFGDNARTYSERASSGIDWKPPKVSANFETVVDITTEKPSGKYTLPAWCCVVKIRNDHVICYAPIPGVHKILITGELLMRFLCLARWRDALELGHWINVVCEPRCPREYDHVRLPHFSHIATKICTAPQRKPPVEPWEQRFRYNLMQVFLRCDLREPGNVRRVQVGNDKYFLLNCMHKIQVLLPFKRLEGIVDAKLTADKQIGMWATRKKRVHDCDMFLIDSEDIVEIAA